MKQRKNGRCTLPTKTLAMLCGVVPATLLVAYRKRGHWRGLVPKMHPSGRQYLWPDRSLELLSERAKTVKPGRPRGDRTVREL